MIRVDLLLVLVETPIHVATKFSFEKGICFWKKKMLLGWGPNSQLPHLDDQKFNFFQRKNKIKYLKIEPQLLSFIKIKSQWLEIKYIIILLKIWLQIEKRIKCFQLQDHLVNVIVDLTNQYVSHDINVTINVKQSHHISFLIALGINS